MKNDNIIIAIDGPSGTGKSTTAKELAKILGFSYLDTGAMYRAVTYYFMINSLAIPPENNITGILSNIQIHFDGIKTFLNNKDITEEIRSYEVNSNVSKIAAVPEIRDFCCILQKKIGKKGRWVVEGRDIGTHVFPDAHYKFYLHASPEVRAKRRWLQDEGRIPLEKVRENIETRDNIDSTRSHSPLKKAEDAVLIDTSDLSFSEVIEKILSFLQAYVKKE